MKKNKKNEEGNGDINVKIMQIEDYSIYLSDYQVSVFKESPDGKIMKRYYFTTLYMAIYDVINMIGVDRIKKAGLSDLKTIAETMERSNNELFEKTKEFINEKFPEGNCGKYTVC